MPIHAQPPPTSDVQKLDEEESVGEQIESYPWQTERCIVLPYREDKFPVGFLQSVWASMAVDGLLTWFFPGRQMDWEEFKRSMADRQVILGFTKPNLELAGAAVLWDIVGERNWRMADFGFAFFRRYWATRLIREIAEIALRSVYSEAGVDRLTGLTLAQNLPARAFAAAMGFEELATLKRWIPTPQGFQDAVVLAQDRESFEHGTVERTEIRKKYGRRVQ